MNVLWNPHEIYGCVDSNCGCQILILRSSQCLVPRPRVPRCMCGGFLMRKLVVPPLPAEGDPKSSPPPEREAS